MSLLCLLTGQGRKQRYSLGATFSVISGPDAIKDGARSLIGDTGEFLKNSLLPLLHVTYYNCYAKLFHKILSLLCNLDLLKLSGRVSLQVAILSSLKHSLVSSYLMPQTRHLSRLLFTTQLH